MWIRNLLPLKDIGDNSLLFCAPEADKWRNNLEKELSSHVIAVVFDETEFQNGKPLSCAGVIRCVCGGMGIIPHIIINL